MKKIILKAKINFKSELNLKNLSKINFEEKIISKINILYDNKEFELQELFKIQVLKSDNNELIIFGTNRNCDYLGWKWKKGILRIKSDVGSFLGVQMIDGKIIVEGSCKHHAGSAITGGKIFIKSNPSQVNEKSVVLPIGTILSIPLSFSALINLVNSSLEIP